MAADNGFMKLIKAKQKKTAVQETIEQIIQQSKDNTARIVKKSNDFAQLADEVLQKKANQI